MRMRELWQDSYWSIKSRFQPRRSKFHTNNSSKFRSRTASSQVMETLGVVLVSTRTHIWCKVQAKNSHRCRNKLQKSSLKELAQRDQILQSVLLAPAEDMETILEVVLDRRLKPRLLAWPLHKFQNLNKWTKEFPTTKHNKINNRQQASNPR